MNPALCDTFPYEIGEGGGWGQVQDEQQTCEVFKTSQV